MTNYQPLAEVLKLTLSKLNLSADSLLHQEIRTVCNYLANPNFRIAIFGPFNHGKSTLLNAILGEKTLPIDLIPTTGAAITVKYGTDTRTKITLRNGEEIYQSGTDILKKFAILDRDRQMRDDVVAVEVCVPNSLLAMGVELLDLPGTNDREAQDQLVQEQLLGADLVIQMLDGRKLMTLGERENLRDWLIDREIKTVIFVANFLNLLEPDEQKSVYNRLLFVAESFRSQLPHGYSNIYRVDALPALRSRLKGDTQGAISSGLVAFESALQNIVTSLQQNRSSVSNPRVEKIAIQLQRELISRITPLKTEISKFENKQKSVTQLKRQAEELISQGFTGSVNKLRTYLEVKNLTDKYQAEAAIALAQNNFIQWEQDKIKTDLDKLQQEVNKWIDQANSFFPNHNQNNYSQNLMILIPDISSFNLETGNNKTTTSSTTKDLQDPASVAVGGGIGWVLGGPIGAAVVGSITYLLNKKIKTEEINNPEENHLRELAKRCLEITDKYFEKLSEKGLEILREYEIKAQKFIHYQPESESSDITQKRLELYRWLLILYHLNQQLEKTLKIDIQTEFKISQPVEPKIINSTTNPTPISNSNNTYQNPVNQNPINQNYPNQNQTHPPSSSTYRYQRTGIKEEVGTQTQQHTKTNTGNSNNQTNSADNPKQSQSQTKKAPTHEQIDANFFNWEIEQELAQMKANMGKNNHDNTTQQTKNPKTHQQKNTNKAYTILGLKPGASITEIKQSYRQLVKKWHPDLFVGKPEELKHAQKNMHEINEAYAILTDSI